MLDIVCQYCSIDLLFCDVFAHFVHGFGNVVFRNIFSIVHIEVLEDHPQLFFRHELINVHGSSKELRVINLAVFVFINL